MSTLDNARRQRSLSPPGSSGRDSPLGRPRRRQVEDEAKKQEKPVRRYASAIERALASFDTGRLEWPDYISFLGRLLKAIQAHPPAIESIPHKNLISNRLAQCLSPALPSGVHQKAIEVYAFVFSLIGKDALASDLNVYLPGLSSVLSFASLSLRPPYLSLIETYIVPLDVSALRPALKAIILSLLPGLEDETSEEYDRILLILDNLREKTSEHESGPSEPSDAYFWQCLFLASISSPSRRQGALGFLSRRLPKLTVDEEGITSETESMNGARQTRDKLSTEAVSVISPEPGLLIRCFATGLSDEQYLLQRGFLDLLLSHLPLNSPILVNFVNNQDLITLMGAALSVVLRRDMSLNRRLWSWLLGPDMVKNEEQETDIPTKIEMEVNHSEGRQPKSAVYFRQYGKKPLIECLLATIQSESSELADRARPFRLGLSLMDRWEIGGQVVQQTFLPMMEALFEYKKVASSNEFEDVLRSASSFFDGVESGIIWGQILNLLTSSLSLDQDDISSSLQRIKIVDFMISSFNVREEEMMTVHEPLVALYILLLSNHRISNRKGADDSFGPLFQSTMEVLEKLLRHIPERRNLNASFGEDKLAIEEKGKSYRSSLVQTIQRFYFQHNGHLALSPPPLSSLKTGNLLLSESANLVKNALRLSSNPKAFSTCTRIFLSFASKLPDCEFTEFEDFVAALVASLESYEEPESKHSEVPLTMLTSIAQFLRKFGNTHPKYFDSVQTGVRRLLALSIPYLWQYLSPSRPKYHLEAIRSLWQLDALPIADSIIESSVSNLLQTGNSTKLPSENQVEQLRRFMVLWAHSTQSDKQSSRRQRAPFLRQASAISEMVTFHEHGGYQERLHRPLMLLLDALVNGDPEVHYTISNWLEYLPDVRAIFEILLSSLGDLELPNFDKDSDEGSSKSQREHGDTSAEYLYYLEHISRLLSLCSERSWNILQEQSHLDADDAENSISKSSVILISELCVKIIQIGSVTSDTRRSSEKLKLSAFSILQTILKCSQPVNIKPLELDEVLIAELRKSLGTGVCNSSFQIAFLDTLSLALRGRAPIPQVKRTPSPHVRKSSITTLRNLSKLSMASDTDVSNNEPDKSQKSDIPVELLKCLQEGISSTASTFVLDRWVKFISEVLPLFADSIFQNLIPVVETFCKRIKQVSDGLQASFKEQEVQANTVSEGSILSLLTGLETILATAHFRMQTEEENTATTKSPEIPHGFFGNVVSGVFASDTQKNRTLAANTRLTVILCLQDSLRVAFDIWSWTSLSNESLAHDQSSAASFSFVSKRIRNRLRRILDRMFAAETLECLENVVAQWSLDRNESPTRTAAFPALSLLQVLDGSRPKVTIPTLFNSIYSRTNPSVLEPNKLSTLTAEIDEIDLAFFLVEYTDTLDDDALDEIWSDCITFLRDVLSNPLPHLQIQPCLLTFVVVLAEKLEKTNFGEQRRMRKELSDLFVRLLSATFTVRATSAIKEPASLTARDENTANGLPSKGRHARDPDVVETLTQILPRIPGTLVDDDRLVTVVTSISTNILSPLIHSKNFPSSMSSTHLALLQSVCKMSQASKVWKKDVQDALLSPRFFSTEWTVGRDSWLPILRQWLLSDKDWITDLCSRIAAPASAGIMFGVGASTARVDADRKTQLNLRRIVLLLLAADVDFAVGKFVSLEEKIMELLQASTSSSPSSNTRAELFMLLLALIQRMSFVHLASLWPLINSELQRAIAASTSNSADYDVYDVPSLLQACKLLDVLLAVAPDDFQMLEWLFITDTIDAVYRPANWEPVGIADEMAEELDEVTNTPVTPAAPLGGGLGATGRTSLALATFDKHTMALPKAEFVNRVLRPFFSGLSIQTYEAKYSLKTVDRDKFQLALLQDLFDDTTIIA